MLCISRNIVFFCHHSFMKKIILSQIKNEPVCTCNEVCCVGLGRRRVVCVRLEETVWNILKADGIEKRKGQTNGRGEAGSKGGSLKKGEAGTPLRTMTCSNLISARSYCGYRKLLGKLSDFITDISGSTYNIYSRWVIIIIVIIFLGKGKLQFWGIIHQIQWINNPQIRNVFLKR